MTRRKATVTPPMLRAIGEYFDSEVDLDMLNRALKAAHGIVANDAVNFREGMRWGFIEEEGDGEPQLAHLPEDDRTTAQTYFGDPAFLLGLACAWVLLRGDGAR